MSDEVCIDPTRYEWLDRHFDEVEMPVVHTYKLRLTRRVRVSRHTEVLRTFTVYCTSPHPRIAGTLTTSINNSEGASNE